MLDVAGLWTYYDDDSLCQISVPRPVVPIISPANAANNFTIYPNPAGEQIAIWPTEPWSDNTDIHVTDLFGHIVMEIIVGEIPAKNGSIQVSIAGLPSGLYAIHVYTGGKIIGNKKFVKIK